MSNNKTKNFSQKGFTGNFLALMKRVEQNELCCLDFLTQVYTQDSSTVSFTGLGTKDSPLIATSSGGSGTPAAPVNSVQFNNAGAFGGSDNLIWTGTVLQITGSIQSSENSSFNGVSVGLGGASSNSNTAVGNGALSSAAGVNNTAIGYKALALNTNNYNTAIGWQALMNSTGQLNVAIGMNALGASAAGNNNVAIGTGVLYNVTTGSGNVSIGHGALQFVTTGVGNISLGNGDSSGHLTTGSYNSFIGYRAEVFAQIVTGNYNTFVGAQFNMPSDVSNTIGISDGTGSARFFSPASGNVILGVNAQSATDNGNAVQVLGNLSAMNIQGAVSVQSSSIVMNSTATSFVFDGTTATSWTAFDMTSSVGKLFFVKNRGSAVLTINAEGTDNFYTTTSVTSITLNPGDAVILLSDGSFINVQ